jgi:hypothetical protein
MSHREATLERLVAKWFAKRHRGAWYRSACREMIRDLRKARAA